MFSRFFSRISANPIPSELYGSVMAQSRQPFFFATFGVPDTVMGRFDMLALHAYLLARRLRSESNPDAVDLSQEVFDLFVADVERALRELGVGDTTVPKRKKKMIRSFYGMIEDFDQPIDQNDMETLKTKAGERFFVDMSDVEIADAQGLADYIMSNAQHLEKQSYTNLGKGELVWLQNND